MLSVLFVSSSQVLVDVIVPILEKGGHRYKHVFDLTVAINWLSLSRYDLLILDEAIPNNNLFNFFSEVWKLSEETRSILVGLNNIHPDKLIFKSVGVEVLGGEDLVDDIKEYFLNYPKKLSLTESMHQRVLVVEDLDSPRAIICSLVESLGFPHVEQASSVQNAIKALLLSPLSYFCVITDINMPEETGFDLISQMRKELSLAYLPIIVLTSDPSDENLVKALKYGISSFLAKPPKKQVLKAELDKAKRIVLNGLSPEVGTASEIRLLEKEIRNRNRL